MGDIVRNVKICGLELDRKLLKPKRRSRDWPEVAALVDTGATASVISSTLAELAGARIMTGARTFRGTPHDGALMVLQLTGCKPSYHLVVVDDHIAAQAGPNAHMILGHDYLQDNRARIDYANGDLVSCPPHESAPGKSASKSKRNGKPRRNGKARRNRT